MIVHVDSTGWTKAVPIYGCTGGFSTVAPLDITIKSKAVLPLDGTLELRLFTME